MRWVALVVAVGWVSVGCINEIMMGDPMDGGVGGASAADGLRINQVQLRGTNNSYHDHIGLMNPMMAYRHLSIDQQAAIHSNNGSRKYYKSTNILFW